MLERQIMFKQLQELLRKKNLQELNNTQQQNVINHLSLMHNVIPVRDPSQMFMFGNTNSVHGLSNQSVHLPAQAFQNGSSQYSHFQDPAHEPNGSFGPVYTQESAGLDSLDPLEQKILFNTEDTEKFENMFEKTDHSSDFPSVQSGSWSALMQSAAAEAVSGDAGIQEEWSGLSFQNPEILNENKNYNMIENVKNSTPWLCNKSPKPELLNTSINGSSSFPGFHHFQNPKTDSSEGGDFKKGFFPDIHRNFEASKAATLYNNSSSSQYFGLRLTPATQRSLKNYSDPSQISQEPDHSNKPFQAPQSDRNQNYASQETPQDGQESSRVASSTRHAHVWANVPPQQNPSGSHVITNFIKQSNTPPRNNSVLNPIKNDNVNYDNNINIPQVTSAYGTYKTPSWLKNHNAESFQRNNTLAQVNLVGNERLSSPYLQHLDMANQNMIVLKSKKRKIPSFERLPWHKEVIEGCSRLHDTSTAELEWTYATNRLPEKLKDEAEELADSKRRLILTTKLMQVLFRPAPDATKQYDIVTYYAAKLALGDACSLASRFHTSRDAPDSFKGSGDLDLSKTIECFIDRSKRLEDEFSRLENGGSSFLDVRMEFQDLEKFSVINRFAKFHSRGPLVVADTTSTNGASIMPKLYPQRYVTASPMPRTVPEGQYCLSL